MGNGPATAEGQTTGRNYTVKDITQDLDYRSMRSEALVAGDGGLVTPVRHKTSPHFRRLGARVVLTELFRASRSTAHNKTVKSLYKALNECGGKVRFYTNVFDEDYRYRLMKAKKAAENAGLPVHDVKVAPSQLPLFSSGVRHDYRWFEEAAGQIRFDDYKYIQPDLTGRDVASFSPSGKNPALIIEVIRTHIPASETFSRLRALSRMGFHVFFYFIAERMGRMKYNEYAVDNGWLNIRISSYLMNGTLYANDAVVDINAVDDSDWCKDALHALEERRREHDPRTP